MTEKRLQELISTVNSTRNFYQHACSSCGLDDEEYAQVKGWNLCCDKLVPIIKELVQEVVKLDGRIRLGSELL